MDERSRAMERRFRLIPCDNFPEKPDLDLEEKLRAEYPGILRKMIDAAAEWIKNGLPACEAVDDLTAEYFENVDNTAHWINDNCATGINKKTGRPYRAPTAVLMKDYNAWARANDAKTVGKNTFATMIDRLKKRGIRRYKGHEGCRMTEGLCQKTEEGPVSYDDPRYDEPTRTERWEH
jgi:putative DNA primase/helicase